MNDWSRAWVGVGLLTAALAATPAQAVRPVTVSHTTEADFENGQTDGTIVTNLGDIKLAVDTTTLAELTEHASIVFDVERLGESLIVAAGAEGKLLRLRDEQIETIATLEGEQAFALLPYDGKLLVAISGTPSRLAIWDGEELTELTTLPEQVRYVWDAVELADGRLVLATGTDGRVLLVDPEQLDADGEDHPGITTLYDAGQSNALCLALDNEASVVYAGTDTDGLVYRLEVDGDEAAVSVVYDAAEPEIGALLVEPDGTLYVGTADANQARPGRMEDAEEEQRGRPEEEGDGAPGEGEQPPGDVPGTPPEEDPMAEHDGSNDAEAEPSAVDAADAVAAAEADAQAETDAQAEPTPAQYDELRETVRARLIEAREQGRMQVGSMGGRARPQAASGSRARPPATPAQDKEGNAVYRISPEGYVSEVFRESVMILRLIRFRDALLVATGNEGQVYRVDPDNEETAVLVDLEAEQVPAMAVDLDGTLLLGTANPAELRTTPGRIAEDGSYLGPIIDAGQISRWGRLTLTLRLPPGSSVQVETRTGNVADPEQGPWQEWSSPITLEPDDELPALQPREVTIDTRPARFLQYRLTLERGDDDASPVIDAVTTTHVTPNLRPSLSSLSASYPEPKEGEPPSTIMNVEWEAEDPNGDALRYRLEARPAEADRYLLLPGAEELEDTSYEWQTRDMPDGRYLLRVIADDSPDNPDELAASASRVSDPVLVDNTPPTLEDLRVRTRDRSVEVEARARDALSPVQRIEYSLNSWEQFRPVLPDDLIFDSTTESWTATIPDLPAGAHVISLRVRDARGNVLHQAIPVEID